MTSAVFDYAARIGRVRGEMARAGCDALMLSVGPDLPYLTGYEAMPLERLTMLVVTQGDAVLIVPRLEAPRVAAGPFEIRPWEETDDPVRLVSDVAGSSDVVAIGDHTWSVFLLRLQEAMHGTRFQPASPIMSRLRARKEPAEIEILRAAAQAADRVVGRLAGTRFSSCMEDDLARMIAAWTVEEGHEAAAFTIVGSGPNGASPHHEPTDRRMSQGDLVVVDFGGRMNGYYSDTTRTFSIGPPSPEQAEVHAVVHAAHQAAVGSVRPGVSAAEIDGAARGVIEEAGYGRYFIHRTGHGIGLEGHEDPYLVATNQQPVEPGMTFSIEPGIYLPGRFGVRIEDIVVVTDEEVETLNRSDRWLIVVS